MKKIHILSFLSVLFLSSASGCGLDINSGSNNDDDETSEDNTNEIFNDDQSDSESNDGETSNEDISNSNDNSSENEDISPLETCHDGIQNQDEENVDCGGTNCDACPDIPLAPSCDDGVMNGDETGVDCGGACNHCVTEQTESIRLCSNTCVYRNSGECDDGWTGGACDYGTDCDDCGERVLELTSENIVPSFSAEYDDEIVVEGRIGDENDSDEIDIPDTSDCCYIEVLPEAEELDLVIRAQGFDSTDETFGAYINDSVTGGERFYGCREASAENSKISVESRAGTGAYQVLVNCEQSTEQIQGINSLDGIETAIPIFAESTSFYQRVSSNQCCEFDVEDHAWIQIYDYRFQHKEENHLGYVFLFRGGSSYCFDDDAGDETDIYGFSIESLYEDALIGMTITCFEDD